MRPGVIWDWPDTRYRRNTRAVAPLIFWSYAGLSITRQLMKVSDPALRKVISRTIIREFGLYNRGERQVGTLERETRIQALTVARCIHCGSENATEMDHLMPRSRGGLNMAFNTITSCGSCNRRRGNRDLMLWYRERRSFPCLALTRHYLKLAHRCASDMQLLDKSPEEALAKGLPFDPRLLPTRYPPVEDLVWDWRFPDHN